MGTQPSVEVSPRQIENARRTWKEFTVMMKCATIGTVAVVAVLGLLFINW